MAPIIPSEITPHIPAWKRLGLKLKSATENQENLAPSPLPIRTPELNTKPKRPRDQSPQPNDAPPAKKAKKSKSSKTNSSSAPSEAQPHSPSLKKRKSVTFTPETKREDGDSIKQLFNAWVDQQKELDPSFGAKNSNQAFETPEPPQVAEQVEDETLTESEKRVKRVKKQEKPKKEKGSKTQSKSKTPAPAPAPPRLSPALSYLRQHHESRDTWKFNKNHQNFIIKHAFDITNIPWDHNEALLHYIAGMKGVVRTRLRDEALKVKVQDQEAGASGFPPGMADPDKKQQEYNAAMAEYVATVTMRDATLADGSLAMGYEEGIALNLSDSAMKERVGKRMRAERILAQLGRDTEAPTTNGGDVDSQKRMRLNDGTAQKPARKRKQRTTGLDGGSSDSSSSSDDDTSSESGSDSEDSSSDEEPTAKRAAAGGNVDSSSSSSDSSSSSSSSESSDEGDNSDDDADGSDED